MHLEHLLIAEAGIDIRFTKLLNVFLGYLVLSDLLVIVNAIGLGLLVVSARGCHRFGLRNVFLTGERLAGLGDASRVVGHRVAERDPV